jgi:acetoin utilization deacetylase AcuC-like enzyme
MLVVVSNSSADDHDAGPGHPERAARTRAAADGLIDAGLHDALVDVAPRQATSAELHRVHSAEYLGTLEAISGAGGGHFDDDTVMSAGSWETALLAAGSGLQAVAALDDGLGDAALVLARPPGHHAGPETAQGFCFLNNISITAAALVERGERVAIIDWDVHHGNGTQEIFWDDPRVLFVSMHQRGLYPGTGRVVDSGGPSAQGTTLNIPLPAFTTGEALRLAMDGLVAPTVAAFAPTWVLVSAGYDGHRHDPLAEWSLTAGDYAELATRVAAMAPQPGRLMAFLEGGYDLPSLAASVGATGAAFLGERYRPEPPSNGDVGLDDVVAISGWRQRQAWAELV